MAVGDGTGRNERGALITESSGSGVGGGKEALTAASGSSGGGKGASAAHNVRP